MPRTQDDAALLRDWAGGSQGAGEVLFKRYVQRLARFFRAKGFVDIDDLVQTTFLSCLEGRARLQEHSSFHVFLFAIARHKALDALRARYQRHRDFDPLERSVADLEPSPSQLVIADLQRQQLHQELRRLPVDLQIAVELHYWEGLSGSELAEALDLPLGTVKTRLRRAKQEVERALQRMQPTN